MTCFSDIYRERTVFITGHTGFKGSWLSYWLTQLGAKVVGYSLPVLNQPNHYHELKLPIISIEGDIRDGDTLRLAILKYQPSIVFHLAAQPLVLQSYKDPIGTISTNVIGTVNLYQACRSCDSVSAVVSVTSDKVYYSKNTSVGYSEEDRLGGVDPYSCSKACVELLSQCWRSAYFNESSSVLLATVRAGNVIGGGDWAADRILPDAYRAVSERTRLRIRSPRAIRPWQHVLEPLAGYLLIGQKLLEGQRRFADAWNFGPGSDGEVDVLSIISAVHEHWPDLDYELTPQANLPVESSILKIDSSKSLRELSWKPVWTWKQAVGKTASWYRDFYHNKVIKTSDDLAAFICDAQRVGLSWVKV